MQKIKLKDYLQAMYHQHKIYNLEVLEGDMVYVGKEIKAKTKDEKALDALADLRSIELGRRSEKDALSRKYEEKHRALRYSIDDIQMIYDSKELKDWDKAIKAEDKIQSDLGDAHYKAVEKLKK